MRRRAGASLAELIVALAITAVVCGLVATPFIAVDRMARHHRSRLTLADAIRLPVVVLRGELRWLAPDADIDALAGDSLALRAFRGAAIVCGLADGDVLVRYRGARSPNPEKDSILVAAGRGAPAVASLAADRPAPGECVEGASGTVRRWAFDAPVAPGALLLVFERGSYHLADRAFRFRRGLAGRQPLTPERLGAASALRALDAVGGVTSDPSAAVAAALILVPAPGPDARVSTFVAPPTVVRVPMLNRSMGSPAAPPGGTR